jgi:mono/diheme cytochrome c family protein
MQSGPGESSGDEGGRRRRFRTWHVLAALLGVALAPGASADEAAPDWARISQIFQERCIMCHSAAAAARGLRLDSYNGAIAGSENGPVLIPGDPHASELVKRLNGSSKPRMPFLSYPLPPETIDLIERWIAAGLPETVVPQTDTGRN